MRVLILCALKQEASLIIRAFQLKNTSASQSSFEGPFANHHLTLAVTGPGKENAISAIDLHLKNPIPDQIIVTGFAGGLDERLASGDLFLAEKIMTGDLAGKALTQNVSASGLTNRCDFSENFKIFRGTLLTADRIISTAEEKKRLGKELGAQAVDMESGWILQRIPLHSIPTLILKGITDSAGESLGIDFSKWMGPRGEICMKEMINDTILHPRKICALIKLALITKKIKKKLAAAIRQILLTS